MRNLPIGRRRVLVSLLAAGLAIPAGVAHAETPTGRTTPAAPPAPAAPLPGSPPTADPPGWPPDAGAPPLAGAGPAAGAAVPAPPAPPITPVLAPRYVDCAVFMLHHARGGEVADLVARNRDAGRRPITVGQLGAYLLGGAAPPAAPLFCLSFDDGYRDQLTHALPVLARLSCPATFFVMGTGWRGDGVHQYMRVDQIVEAARLVEIGSHTINHDPNLIALRARNPGAYMAEIVGSKQQLEDLLGRPVTSFASPNSVYDDALIADAARAGYAVAVMTAPDPAHARTRLTAADRYRIPRARVT
jgi:peptidoglycan/xylan/chitin deacetylase (PgdA/CDA1 family)